MTMPKDTPTQMVYGYVRVEEPDEIEIALLRKEMADYCVANNYQLATVCCDRGGDSTEWSRAGFTAALDALALPSTYGLLVPALGHLSTDPIMRDGLVRLVKRTGARLLVLNASSEEQTPAEADS
jgi:hypothetical protein